MLCRNKSSTEFMLSASDKRRYIKRLIFLVSVAEQAGSNRGLNTTLGLSETPKTDYLARCSLLKLLKNRLSYVSFWNTDRASNRSCDPDQVQLFIGPGSKRFAKVTSRRQK